MGLTVMLDETHPDYGRASGVWWDEDSNRSDGFVPPIPTGDDPFYRREQAVAAGHEAVEAFFNGPIPYPQDEGGPVYVGVVPLDHTFRDGERLSKQELAERRWNKNANPDEGVLVGRVFPDHVKRPDGSQKMVFRFEGAVRAGTDANIAAKLVGSGLSGEWLAGETYGPAIVNNQGFPAAHYGQLAKAAASAGECGPCSGPLCPPGEICILPGMTPEHTSVAVAAADQLLDQQETVQTEAVAESQASQEARNSIDAAMQSIAAVRTEVTDLVSRAEQTDTRLDQIKATLDNIERAQMRSDMETTTSAEISDRAKLAEQVQALTAAVAELRRAQNLDIAEGQDDTNPVAVPGA